MKKNGDEKDQISLRKMVNLKLQLLKVFFITNQQNAQAMYQQFAKLQLLKVGETRHASQYIMKWQRILVREQQPC
jgi:hypothetical protein